MHLSQSTFFFHYNNEDKATNRGIVQYLSDQDELRLFFKKPLFFIINNSPMIFYQMMSIQLEFSFVVQTSWNFMIQGKSVNYHHAIQTQS